MGFVNTIKKEKGITGIDISISILIITVFTGIIVALFYNIYITAFSIQKADEATNIAINVIEYAQKLEYDQLLDGPSSDTENSVGSLMRLYINDEDNTPDMKIPNGYSCRTTVSQYINPEDPGENVVKIIDIEVSYKVGKKTETFDIKAFKIKEL